MMMPRRANKRSHILARLTLSAAAVAAVSLFASCERQAPAAAPSAAQSPTAVQLVPIAVHPIDRFVEVTGTLHGEEELVVSAEVPGRIVEVAADLGDTAASGSILAQIDRTDYQLAVEEQRSALSAALAKLGLSEIPEGEIDLEMVPVVARAQASLANAKARLDRARKLFERQPPMMSAQDFADIETEHAVAATSASVERLNAQSLLADARVKASAVRIAEQRLADSTVLAPRERELKFKVAKRLVSTGEVVAQGQPLFRLVASDRIKFRGSVPERFASQIVAGAVARLHLDGFDEPFQGVVARVSPAVDVASRTFEIEIEADNADGRLKPGSFARAEILVSTQVDAKFVPEDAVTEFAGTQRIFSVKDGKAVEHRVQLGPASGGEREILDAIPSLTHVIANPRALAPNTPVTVTGTPSGS